MSQKSKVLVLEDDEFHRTILADGLEDYYDYEVFMAESLERADELLETLVPDLLVLDCVLGDDRFQVIEWAKRLRKRRVFSRTPVLFVTAFYQEMEGHVREIERSLILAKPFTFQDVTQKMSELLALPK